MDATRFDSLARFLTAGSSRRYLMRGLGALGLGFGAARFPETASGKKTRKKRKKLKRNAFGCVNVGGKCRGKDRVCCSGICNGKKPKKGKKDRSRCVAHNVLDCQPGQGTCGFGACGTSGACYRTTGQAGFCASNGDCVSCRKDADCDAMGFGPGAACILCEGCGGVSDTACFRPAS